MYLQADQLKARYSTGPLALPVKQLAQLLAAGSTYDEQQVLQVRACSAAWHGSAALSAACHGHALARHGRYDHIWPPIVPVKLCKDACHGDGSRLSCSLHQCVTSVYLHLTMATWQHGLLMMRPSCSASATNARHLQGLPAAFQKARSAPDCSSGQLTEVLELAAGLLFCGNSGPLHSQLLAALSPPPGHGADALHASVARQVLDHARLRLPGYSTWILLKFDEVHGQCMGASVRAGHQDLSTHMQGAMGLKEHSCWQL